MITLASALQLKGHQDDPVTSRQFRVFVSYFVPSIYDSQNNKCRRGRVHPVIASSIFKKTARHYDLISEIL